MKLLDQRIVFLFPFVPVSESPPEGFVSCSRREDEALRLYLTPSVYEKLHHRRWAWPEVLSFDEPAVVLESLEVAEMSASAPSCQVLSLVFRLAGEPSLEDLLRFTDLARLRGPLYPGQQRPLWKLGNQSFAALENLLEHWIPGARPVFPDRRLPTFTYAAFDSDPGPALRYAICAADPPEMPAPPTEVVQQFFRSQAYRRWEGAGTFYAFTHYSGGLICTQGASDWMARLVSNQYLDLAHWVVTVAAWRRRRATDLLVEADSPDRLWREYVEMERERFSEQDQGRQLVRQWLSVIEQDAGDLAFIEKLLAHCFPVDPGNLREAGHE